MSNESTAIRLLAEHFREKLDNGLNVLSESRVYYSGKGNICQKMNIVLGASLPNRDERLAFVRYLFNLPSPITSTKDLTFGHALAIWKMASSIPAAVAAWRKATKEAA